MRRAYHLWFLLIFYDDVYRWQISPPCLGSRQIILKGIHLSCLHVFNIRTPPPPPCGTRTCCGVHWQFAFIYPVYTMVDTLLPIPIFWQVAERNKKKSKCLLCFRHLSESRFSLDTLHRRFNWLCWGLTTRQPLWVILCHLPEKGRKEIEERVEEMKERDREERGTGIKVKKQK